MANIEDTDAKSYRQYEVELGTTTAEMAEVLAAMDCLMHHLSDKEDMRQWEAVAIEEGHNWNILDWDVLAGASRCQSYMEEAKNMSGHEFECIVRTFASIISGQCFGTVYNEGAFDYGYQTKQDNEDKKGLKNDKS